MSGVPRGEIRRATFDDALTITGFLRGLGLEMPEDAEAVRRHWRALWVDNPALSQHPAEVVLGWVLEDAGEIKGFFGNIPQLSWLDGKEVLVSSARAWAVAPDYRSETARLCSAFFECSAVDLLLISSASSAAGRRCQSFGAGRMPQPAYDEILFWISDSAGFLSAAARKKGQGGVASRVFGLLGSIPLDFRVRIGGRRPYAPLSHISSVPLSGIDDAFDDLWNRRRAQLPNVLLATRDARMLRWYFGLGSRHEETRAVRYDKDGRLFGYVILIREDSEKIGLRRLKIADMLVDNDDPDVAKALFAAAYDYATAQQCHVLEVIGLPPALRSVAEGQKPYRRSMPTFPFYYKALDPGLATALANPNAWYVTAFDGDTALL